MHALFDFFLHANFSKEKFNTRNKLCLFSMIWSRPRYYVLMCFCGHLAVLVKPFIGHFSNNFTATKFIKNNLNNELVWNKVFPCYASSEYKLVTNRFVCSLKRLTFFCKLVVRCFAYRDLYSERQYILQDKT